MSGWVNAGTRRWCFTAQIYCICFFFSIHSRSQNLSTARFTSFHGDYKENSSCASLWTTIIVSKHALTNTIKKEGMNSTQLYFSALKDL